MKRIEVTDFITPLREPQVLSYMHEMAERTHDGWKVNHILVFRIVERALGGVEASLSMLGVEVQEVVACHTQVETPRPVIVESPLTIGQVVDSSARPRDSLFDTVAGFKDTEPHRFELVEQVVAEYFVTPESRNFAMMGAALSHSLQLSQALHGFESPNEVNGS